MHSFALQSKTANLVILVNVPIAASSRNVHAGEHNLHRMKSCLLLSVREVCILSTRPKVIIFNNNVAAFVAEVNDNGLDILINIRLVYFIPIA